MSDQLAGWLQAVLEAPGFLVAIIYLLNGAMQPRRRRTLRLSHWKCGGIERVRLDVTDDSQP
jgi:hypothetical protein